MGSDLPAGRYVYERLDEKRFQQLCGALLKVSDPDVTCYPVGQRDGGRDARGRSAGIIYQDKWAKQQPKNPVTWLEKTIKAETGNIRRLVEEGAREYILMTSVAGTAYPERGTMDRLDEVLDRFSEDFGIPMRPEWRDDLDRRLESAPVELLWSYPELLTGVDAMRYLFEAERLAANEQKLRNLLSAFMKTQWAEDAHVKFKQAELDDRDLLDLFVDVEATRVAAPRRLGARFNAADHVDSLGGAAAYLLSTGRPLTVVQGAPGQGKSTLGQYLCQVHRAQFISVEEFRAGKTPTAKPTRPRFAIRADLRDYAAWRAGVNPFDDADDGTAEQPKAKVPRPGSLEQFLAELIHARSGGLPADAGTVREITSRFAILIVLDGLDEVALPPMRARIVKEIDSFAARLGEGEGQSQLIVTTRPNASGLAEPSADVFETIALSRLSPELRIAYLRKWATAHDIRGRERREVERIFRERSAEPHIDALADNPMQLTILLYIIHKRGKSIPAARTPLYTYYMETLLDREAAKTAEVEQHREDLEEVTSYLGWHLHATAETTGDEGRLATRALKKAILDYLFGVEKDTGMVEALFTGVTDRVWALSSQVQGTFEFDVQPLREYFAARYLYEFAGADQQSIDRAAVLGHLIRRAYWLNTARFFAGFAKANEQAGLVDGLADEFEAMVRPRQTRLAGWTVFADGVFRARPRTKRNAAKLFIDDELSLRLIAHALTAETDTARPAHEGGGRELIELLQHSIEIQPADPLTPERVAILGALQSRQDFDSWWRPQMRDAASGPHQAAWLHIGTPLQAASRLDNDHIDALDLADDECLPGALAAGVTPAPASAMEHRMIQAVLAGRCADVQGVTGSVPSDLLTVLAPQHMLRKASGEQRAYTLAVGHLDAPAADWQRQAAMRRLIEHDSRFERIQRSLRFGKGQTGTTSPWANTARALKMIYGPCWLAAEIAIIGAAIPDDPFRTSGDLDPGSDPLGPNSDYGRLLRDVRLNRHRADWWATQFTNHSDQLSRATCALALVATAAEAALLANLDHLNAVVAEVPVEMIRSLVASSSRIAASGLARRIGRDAVRAAAGMNTATALLVAHHAARERPVQLAAYSDDLLGEFSAFGVSSWPALSVLTWRMRQQPSSALLAHVRRFGPSFPQLPFDLPPEAAKHSREILAAPAEYPLGWVLAAERLVSNAAADAPLSEIAHHNGWFGA